MSRGTEQGTLSAAPTEGTGVPLNGAAQRRSERRMWWGVFALFAGLISLWSLSMPAHSSPDENAHVIKAAAVVRGQWLGQDELTRAGDTITHVRVPAAQVSGVPCFAHKPRVTADCALPLPTSTELVDAGTLAGHYQPLYYGLVGLGSLLAPGLLGLYLMRVIAALLCAALLASALQSVRTWGSDLGVVGFAVAVTPMVFFMAAGVNPSGMEITAAIGVWTSLLALLHAPARAERRLVVRLVLAACAMVLSRSLSPLLLLVVVGIALLSVPAAAWWVALRRADVRIAVVAVVAATALASTWILLAGALTLRPSRHREDLSFLGAFVGSMERLPYRTRQMVGFFGWLDTPLPAVIYLGWAAGVLLLLLVFLVANRGRRLMPVAALLLAIGVLPSLIEASQHQSLGYVWQGRYTLPIAVGLPLLLARSSNVHLVPLVRRALRPLQVPVIALALAAQVVAFVTNLRRNTVGLNENLDLLSSSWPWQPPLPPLFLVVAFVTLTAGLAVALLRTAFRGSSTIRLARVRLDGRSALSSIDPSAHTRADS